MIQNFYTDTIKQNLTNGEPVIRPDYSHAVDTDSFSIQLPNGELLCVEYDSDDLGGHIFILSADSSKIVKKIR